jgi:uncharacterized repeat protein (TIGR01451 family)
MNKLQGTFISLIAITALALVYVGKIQAQECHSVYGGGQVCDNGNIDINKRVWNPNKSEWWDNIDSANFVFHANDEVDYQIVVKNTGRVNLSQINVTDFMPNIDYLVWQSGGSWNNDNKTIIWQINNLDDGQSQTLSATFKFKDHNSIPKGTTCITNNAQAVVVNGNSDNDSASICVREGQGLTQVLGITTMPPTGVNPQVILALELMGLGGMGLAFVKVSRKLA